MLVVFAEVPFVRAVRCRDAVDRGRLVAHLLDRNAALGAKARCRRDCEQQDRNEAGDIATASVGVRPKGRHWCGLHCIRGIGVAAAPVNRDRRAVGKAASRHGCRQISVPGKGLVLKRTRAGAKRRESGPEPVDRRARCSRRRPPAMARRTLQGIDSAWHRTPSGHGRRGRRTASSVVRSLSAIGKSAPGWPEALSLRIRNQFLSNGVRLHGAGAKSEQPTRCRLKLFRLSISILSAASACRDEPKLPPITGLPSVGQGIS